MSDLQRQIKKTLAEVQQMAKVKKHLADLEQRLTAAYAAQSQLAQLLTEEYEDLDELEELSLKSLFYKVLGSQATQM